MLVVVILHSCVIAGCRIPNWRFVHPLWEARHAVLVGLRIARLEADADCAAFGWAGPSCSIVAGVGSGGCCVFVVVVVV